MLVIAVFALLYALHEGLLLRLPQPERNWQVPNAWIMRWPILGTAMFGAVLGTGLLTFIPYSSYYVLLAWTAGTGSLVLATALGATYGLVRGLPSILGGLIILSGGHPLNLNTWLMERAPAWHRLSSGLLAGIAGFLWSSCCACEPAPHRTPPTRPRPVPGGAGSSLRRSHFGIGSADRVKTRCYAARRSSGARANCKGISPPPPAHPPLKQV